MNRSLIQTLINTCFNKNNRAIVLSSMGRSGSTMLFHAVGKSAVTLSSRILTNPYKHILKNAWELEDASFQRGFIYKTHDYPSDGLYQSGVQCIYTYSDPLAVIPSVIKKTEEEGVQWLQTHAQHLRVSNMESTDELCRRDALQLEKHFDRWTGTKDCNVLAIRLDALWKHRDELSEFAGFRVKLPEKRERSTGPDDLPGEQEEQLRETYASLREKVLEHEIIRPSDSR